MNTAPSPASDQLDGRLTGLAESMSPRLQRATGTLISGLAAREREALSKAARSAPFARESLWMMFLPITRRQMTAMARIYSFQLTKTKDGQPGEYRMSLANGAAELNIDRDHFKNDLRELVAMGFLIKRSNGLRRPATYTVDEVACLVVAQQNGYII